MCEHASAPSLCLTGEAENFLNTSINTALMHDIIGEQDFHILGGRLDGLYQEGAKESKDPVAIKNINRIYGN